MFHRIADLWQCDHHVNCSGKMCISPERIIYFTDCSHNIYSYDLKTKVSQKLRPISPNRVRGNGSEPALAQKIYTYGRAIDYIFWADLRMQDQSLYIGEVPDELYRLYQKDGWILEHVTQYGPSYRGPYYIYTDEHWNVFRQSGSICSFHLFDNNRPLLPFLALEKDEFPLYVTRSSYGHALKYVDPHRQEWHLYPMTPYKDSFQCILGRRDNIFYVVHTTMAETRSLARLTLPNNEQKEIKREILSTNLPVTTCVDSLRGEIYAIDRSASGLSSLYVYIYPLKSLLDQCIGVIAKSPALRQAIPLLPEDLRVRFTYNIIHTNV